MLQQTQVVTVLRHFDRFIARFPDIVSLQRATQDEVLSAWSGLGYYRRVLRMHEAANIIVQKYSGQLPNTLSELRSLPGIGRSTAGSILASAWDCPAPILDANVRRVLSRYHGINGPDGTRVPERQMWVLAESHTPQQCGRIYNQAIMDFGATWCTPKRPRCTECPISTSCIAYQQNQIAEFPAPRNKSQIRSKTLQSLVVFDKNFACLLRQREISGTYARMWDTPEFTTSMQARTLLGQLQLPTTDLTLLERVHKSSYRISTQKISELLTVAKYSVPSIKLGTPLNTQWTSFHLLTNVGLPVTTKQRIELAKHMVESQ